MTTQKIIGGYPFVRYQPPTCPTPTLLQNTDKLLAAMNTRRSIRAFSDKPVPREAIEKLIRIAASAPSGANKQPWTFCAVQDPLLKKSIRMAAEKEEFTSYNGRMPEEWLEDLRPLQTDWQKPFLETAPWLIVVFKKSYDITADGRKKNNYYVQESVGIAVGFLLAAIHQVGLSALTHTPSPMNFLCKLLQRPENEKPFLLIPVGYPAAECWVPDLQKKNLQEVAIFY